ncbi:MAG: nickel-responsive transcriptional regulator NikR [Bryobacteraceae bacterium]|nr:nickel-responsive transcriptional regulator NikR [Bryobacteraceae bacterium]
MADLARIGVAIDEDLLEKFDNHIARKGYANRSEAFRDLIRDDLIREEVADPARDVVGSLTLVYDHHVRLLSEKLTELQHEHHESIVSTVHVHLTHHDCLEVLVLRGKSSEVRQIADRLLATKGVKHGKLVITAAA